MPATINRELRVYIAGPMRGLPRWNFDAFDAAAVRWRAAGHRPISPADIDRAMGVDPDVASQHVTEQFIRQAMQMDVAVLYHSDAIALLPGWENSVGVTVELALAQYLGLMIFDAITMEQINPTLKPWREIKVAYHPGQDRKL